MREDFKDILDLKGQRIGHGKVGKALGKEEWHKQGESAEAQSYYG